MAKRRNEEIVILASSIPKLLENSIPFLFTDRHAYTQLADFFNQYNDLSNLDWNILQNRDFQRDANDPEKLERYQAEALVYRHLPVQSLLGIVCYTEEIKLQLEQAVQVRSLALEVHKMTQWIVNFPTKQHWRTPSKLEWIVEGLKDLRSFIVDNNVRSIAIPPLGAGNGKLNWDDVKPHIEQTLADLEDVDVYVYEPTSQYQNVAK